MGSIRSSCPPDRPRLTNDRPVITIKAEGSTMKALRIAGFGKSEIAFDMFDLPRHAADAKRTQKLEAIYHRGQELAWEGKEVLPELLAKHGGIGVNLSPEKRAALANI